MKSHRPTIWLINQYASTPESGMGGRWYYIACELVNLGYTVYLIAASNNHLLRKPPKFQGKFKIQDDGGGFKVVWVRVPRYNTPRSKMRIFNWFLFSWRLRQLRRLIPDAPDAILYSSPALPGFLGAKYLASFYRVPLVFDVRDIWPLTLRQLGGYSRSHPFIRLLQWMEDKAYRDADRVTSNLRNADRHMISRGMPQEKFTWIPNGCYMKEVGSPESISPRMDSILSSLHGKFIVGYIGTIGVANTLRTLLDAAVLLAGRNDIHFFVVGDGAEKPALLRHVEQYNLKNVTFMEAVPKAQVQSILSKLDACFIGWLNNDLYKFGIGANKIPEYLYSGKPIIHAYSGSADPVEEYQAGITVPAEDAKGVAEAIIRLRAMPVADRSAMGQRGHDAVLRQYEYGFLARKVAGVLLNADD